MSQLPLQENSISRDLARRIAARGLRPIALLALEAGRPLALLAAQLVWMAQPLLSLAWQRQRLAQWAQFLEGPRNIDAMIEYLEAED